MGIVWFEIQQKSNASNFASCVNLLIFNTFALRKIKKKEKFLEKGLLLSLFLFVSNFSFCLNELVKCQKCNILLQQVAGYPKATQRLQKKCFNLFFFTQISLDAIKSDCDEIALQGIEFWSSICDEEMDLEIEAVEVRIVSCIDFSIS